jgi:prephenate dehydrogenase
LRRPARRTANSRTVVVVAGLGLVGGSLARALKGSACSVVGVDRASVLRRARAAGVLSRGFRSLEPALEGASLLVLAAPPRASVRLLRRAARAAPELIVTDVTSVKREIVAEARRLGLRRFVGGHPIAGTEGRGFAAATPELFRGRAWVLTPEGASREAVRVVRALVRATGAYPVIMNAADHDHVLARLSHLPQLVAWALYATATGDGTTRKRLRLAGPGFRDMTRLSRSPRALWREIVAGNRDEVARALRAFSRSLHTQTRIFGASGRA